jgi:hypothetical protein
MPEDKKDEELVMPRFLSEITGTSKEVLQRKSQLIAKFGLSAFEELVTRSSRSTIK